MAYSDDKRLYVTKDIYKEAYYIRTEKEKFAKFHRLNNMWYAWFYPFSYTLKFETLTKLLKKAESLYVKYYYESHEEKPNPLKL